MKDNNKIKFSYQVPFTANLTIGIEKNVLLMLRKIRANRNFSYSK